MGYLDCKMELNEYLTNILKSANKLNNYESVDEYTVSCGYGIVVKINSKKGNYKLYIHKSIVESDDPIETVKNMVRDGIDVPIKTEPFFYD